MESTVTANAMSLSLLARNVYGVCFTMRDSRELLRGELAQAREKFFTGGRRALRVGKNEVVRGFDGKLRGKLSRHGFYWKKSAGSLALEESFQQRGGYLLVTRDFRGAIVSRMFFDKSLLWVKSEYYEPWDAQNPRVMFKPVDSDDLVERFDWDAQNKRYRSTMLHPVPYGEGTARQSLINARFGEPQLLVSTKEGMFCYCPQQEAQARRKALEDLKDGTLVLLPAWEVKEGAIAGEEEEKGPRVTFSSLEEYAHVEEPAAGKAAPMEETPAEAGEDVEEPQPAPAQEEEESAEAEPAAKEEAAPPVVEGTPSAEDSSTEGAQEKEVPEDREEQLKKAQEESPAPVAAEEPAFQRVVDGKVQKGPAVLEKAQQVSHQEEAPLSPVREPEDPESRAILQAARQAAGVLKEGQNGGPFYQGELREGKPWGRGRSQQPNGLTTYEGEFRDGKREGFGVSYYKDGNPCYAGSWKEGLKEGLGVSFRDSDHALHISQWKQGTPEAFVSLFDKEGNLRYGGRIEEGQKQGAGVSYSCGDGTVFVGKWRDGQPTGVGSAFDREGNLLYYGGWKDGKREGHGTEFDPTGAIIFDGEWKDGKYFNGILYQKKGPEGLEEGAAASGGDLPGWDGLN